MIKKLLKSFLAFLLSISIFSIGAFENGKVLADNDFFVDGEMKLGTVYTKLVQKDPDMTYRAMSFTPTESDDYVFITSGELYVNVMFYDSDKEPLYNDYTQYLAGKGYNGAVSSYLYAGKTYYFRVGTTQDGSYTMRVEKRQDLKSLTIPVQTAYYDGYQYQHNIYNITLTTSGGNTYQGKLDDVMSQFCFDYGYKPAYEYNSIGPSSWVQGNTYSGTLKILGTSKSYEITPAASPVKSISVSSLNVVNGTATEQYDFDQNKYYDKYRYTPLNVKVTCNDGSVFEGYADVVTNIIYDKYGVFMSYEITDSQSYNTTWKTGNTYTAQLKLGNMTASFNVSVIDNPIRSLSAQDIRMTSGSYRYMSDYDGSFKYYDIENTIIRIEAGNGKTYMGAPDYAINQLSRDYNTKMNFILELNGGNYQSPYYTLTNGTHTVNLKVATSSTSYKCTIFDKPYMNDHPLARYYGDNRYQTSIWVAEGMKAQFGFDYFNSIIIASGTEFADALAGSFLAAVKSAPILLTSNGSSRMKKTAEYVKQNLADGGTVYILGGTAAIPSDMETALTAAGISKSSIKRLAGNTRYSTNLAILEEAYSPQFAEMMGILIVATGEGYADSLSVSSTGRPIMLVKNSLSKAQIAFLEKHTNEIKEIIIVGGTSAVAEDVEKDLYKYAYTVTRLAGDTRYQTSAKIAAHFFPTSRIVTLASGKDFPDGLSAGPFAFMAKSPVLLATNSNSSIATAQEYVNFNNLIYGYIIGGSGVISDMTALQILSAPSSFPPPIEVNPF